MACRKASTISGGFSSPIVLFMLPYGMQRRALAGVCRSESDAAQAGPSCPHRDVFETHEKYCPEKAKPAAPEDFFEWGTEAGIRPHMRSCRLFQQVGKRKAEQEAASAFRRKAGACGWPEMSGGTGLQLTTGRISPIALQGAPANG